MSLFKRGEVSSFDSILGDVSFQKRQTRYRNVRLALEEHLLQTRAQARDGCVVSRCSSEGEEQILVSPRGGGLGSRPKKMYGEMGSSTI